MLFWKASWVYSGKATSLRAWGKGLGLGFRRVSLKSQPVRLKNLPDIPEKTIHIAEDGAAMLNMVP